MAFVCVTRVCTPSQHSFCAGWTLAPADIFNETRNVCFGVACPEAESFWGLPVVVNK